MFTVETWAIIGGILTGYELTRFALSFDKPKRK